MNKIKALCLCLATIVVFNLIVFRGSLFTTEAENVDPKDTVTSKTDFKEIPEVMNDDESLKDNFVIRLDDETDSLDVIRYLDSFDTERYLLFPINVKYVNEEGIIRDKSNTLYESEDDRYLCVNLDNDIRTYFPKYAAEGIKLTYEDNEILFRPNVKTVNEKQGYISDNTVVYLNAFGEGTDFVVKSTFAGNKSDIILNSYTGENVFEYTFEMKDMSLSFKDGAVCIIDANGNAVCSFGEVYVEDSEGHFTFGTAEVTDKNTVRVKVPEEFLKGKDTVYPVTVDPDIYFTTVNTYGVPNISTSNMKSEASSPVEAITENAVMRLSYGSSPTEYFTPILRFQNLYWVIQDMSSIYSASLTLYRKNAYSGTVDVTVTGWPITQSWSTGYYNASNYLSLYNAVYTDNLDYKTASKVKVGASATGSNNFSLTKLVRCWKTGTWTDANGGVYGIHFFASDYSSPVTFHGATTATASKMPRLTLQIPYDATGTISDAVYMMNPTMYYVGGQNSGYALTRVEENGIPKAKVTPISEISNNVNYPITDSGYVSYMRSTSQLFSIKWGGNGYTIKCLATDQYLAYDGLNVFFTSNDDQTMFTTRWTFVKVNGNYYVLSYFGAFLYSPSATGTCTVTARTYTEGDGRFWHLMFYMLDVEHVFQTENYTCGVATARMILSYLGVDTSDYTDEYLWSYGLYLTNNAWYTHEMPVDPGPELRDPNIQYRPSYGIEQVTKTIIQLLKNTSYELSYSMSLIYFSEYSQATVVNAIKNNLSDGFIVGTHITNTLISNELIYTTTGHYLVIAGCYKDTNNSDRVILIDPHPNTNPVIGSANAIIDMAMDDFYPLMHHAQALIRTTN